MSVLDTQRPSVARKFNGGEMRCAVVALITTLAAGGVAIETLVSASSQRPTFRSEVGLVVVRVTVVDTDNRPIIGLTKDDFVVLDNGAPQPVVHFLSSDVPLDVALLLDTSASVRPVLRNLQTTAMTFLKRLRSRDRGLVASFADRTAILANLTDDRKQLRDAVGQLYARGETSLYDGIYVTLGTLSSAPRDVARRQALVVLTDGRDTASNLGLEDVRRQAIKSGVPLYPILLIDEDPVATSRFEKTLGLFDIIELARETGGRVFRVDEETNLEQTYALIARELSTQYVLAYVALGHRPGVPTAIAVRIPSRPDAVAHARGGYTNRSRDALAVKPVTN